MSHKKILSEPGMVKHDIHFSTRDATAGGLLEANLDYSLYTDYILL